MRSSPTRVRRRRNSSNRIKGSSRCREFRTKSRKSRKTMTRSFYSESTSSKSRKTSWLAWLGRSDQANLHFWEQSRTSWIKSKARPTSMEGSNLSLKLPGSGTNRSETTFYSEKSTTKINTRKSFKFASWRRILSCCLEKIKPKSESEASIFQEGRKWGFRLPGLSTKMQKST